MAKRKVSTGKPKYGMLTDSRVSRKAAYFKGQGLPRGRRRIRVLFEDPRMERIARKMNKDERRYYNQMCDPEPAMRAFGLDSLASTGKKEFIPLFEGMLKDRGAFRSSDGAWATESRQDFVRSHAIKALVELNAVGSFPLIERMVNDSERWVRMDAMDALEAMSDKTKHQRLYAELAGDSEFFDRKRVSVRRAFEKTDAKTTVLGGRLLRRAIVREVSADALEAWELALKSRKAWKEAGFDYIPVEPILRKRGKTGARLRIRRTTDGRYRVFSRALGKTLHGYALSARRKKLQQEGGAVVEPIAMSDLYSKELSEQRARIERVIESLGIDFGYGHQHIWNYCVVEHKGKPRVYVIDFDRAKVKR